MKLGRVFLIGSAAIAISTIQALAGPCSKEIRDVRLELSKHQSSHLSNLPAKAPQSSEAMMHRQPTQRSVADALEQLGEVSPDDARAFKEAMRRAHKADSAGDKVRCEAALKDARAALAHSD
jgi:hypothetical protein